MHSILRRTALSFLIVFGLASCASMSTIENAPLTDGETKIFQADYEKVKAAALISLEAQKLDVQNTEDVDGGQAIYFTKPVSGFSWGEVGRVFVEKGMNGNTKVYVKTARRSSTNITATSQSTFAKRIFAGIEDNI